jgi:alkylhydroperoxidase family enzyme
MQENSTATQERTGSRLRNPQQLVPELAEVGAALFKATGNLVVLHTGNLRTAGESEERIAAVATWQDAPYFTEAERAALALAEAVAQPSAAGERVTDELYARAAEHYDEQAMATLAMAIGQVNFFVALAVIGKPLPGRPPAEQWTPVRDR